MTKYDPKIKRALHRNNAKTRRRKMVAVNDEQPDSTCRITLPLMWESLQVYNSLMREPKLVIWGMDWSTWLRECSCMACHLKILFFIWRNSWGSNTIKSPTTTRDYISLPTFLLGKSLRPAFGLTKLEHYHLGLVFNAILAKILPSGKVYAADQRNLKFYPIWARVLIWSLWMV